MVIPLVRLEMLSAQSLATLRRSARIFWADDGYPEDHAREVHDFSPEAEVQEDHRAAGS